MLSQSNLMVRLLGFEPRLTLLGPTAYKAVALTIELKTLIRDGRLRIELVAQFVLSNRTS